MTPGNHIDPEDVGASSNGSERLSRDETVRVALARFEPLKEGERERSVEDLAATFELPKKVVARAIRNAFASKWVEVREVVPAFEPEDLDGNERLSHQFVERFELNDAIVVKTTASDSDGIHRQLGRTMAFSMGNHIRDNDRIGLGSGRGPYFSITGLTLLKKLKRKNLTLLSMTGTLYPRVHEKTTNELLDADLNAYLMGTAISDPVSHEFLRELIAHDDIEVVRARTWLADTRFKDRCPTVALLGVGVLKQGHRGHDAVTNGASEVALRPILGDLGKLVKLTDAAKAELGAGDYHPVADLCNRLFFLPPTGRALSAGLRLDIEQAIDAVNAHVLTPTWEQLGAIDSLLLVAGHVSKAPAILHLLERKDIKVRVLCTDERTAERVLELSKT